MFLEFICICCLSQNFSSEWYYSEKVLKRINIELNGQIIFLKNLFSLDQGDSLFVIVPYL